VNHTLVTVKSVDDCPFGITYNDGDTHLHMDVPDRNLDIYDVDIIIEWLSAFRIDMVKARDGE
jgi:hypothetical protein|tara:strand:- start:372 stop:560 length:189 start_codon:yes stop_codon:yes gene_type:complete